MMKKTVSQLALAVAATFALAGAASAQEVYIPLISKGFQHQFWQAVKSGAEQAGKDYKVKISFEGPESEAMVDKQIDMLSAALAKKPAAIGFAALDSQAALPLLKKAQAAKIPVIAFDSGVAGDIPVTTASTDNKAAASLAADKMAELIGKAGEVAVVAHDQTSRTGVDRRDGFVDRIKSTYPNIKVVSVQYGGGDHLKSTEIAKSILQAYPNLKGIFGTNEGSAIGVANGVREMKRKVVIVGYDSGKQQKDAIRDGLIAGSITQNPVGIGYKTVEAAVKALKGEKLPKVIDTGFYWYDKTNLNDPKIAAVLYD
ncbi:ABC transporter substrate-binding protein [Ideonella azotifigens]|uniref:ABC transporter substrate-binding protein n=1 Tax=Ideonella azotifigens TaxID=513160 RepID=A0ABN1K7R2_9BURK|nr:ABC transporter substrate-binding protein [Ideonella azotifigens]MCD2342345.1 ABC transporter substrate-binding protein [Ideonella azotifigens]